MDPASRPARRRALGATLRVLASLSVLGAVAVVVGGPSIVAGTAVLRPGPVAAAVLLGLLWRALAATRWLLLARALGAPLGWSQAYGEYLRSELLNQVLPGGVLGDVDRARRHGQDLGLLAAARAVAAERVAGQVVLVAAVVGVVLLRPEMRRVASGVDGRTVAVLAVGLALVVVVGLVLWQPWRRAAPPAPPGPAHDDPPARRDRRALLGATLAAIGLSVLVLACFVGLFVLAARTTGPATGLRDLVPAVIVVLLVSGIPLTVSGWGAREAGAALGFAAVGLAAADGGAAAVGYGLLSLLSSLPGLVPLLLPRRPDRRPAGRLRRASAVRGRGLHRARARSGTAGRS